MLIIGVVLASTVINLCPQADSKFTRAIDDAASQLYLDPSDQGRRRITRQLIRDVLTPLSQRGAIRSRPIECTAMMLSEAALLADEKMFTDASATIASSLESAPNTTDAKTAAELVRSASIRFDMRAWNARPAPEQAILLENARAHCTAGFGGTGCSLSDVLTMFSADPVGSAEILRRHPHSGTGRRRGSSFVAISNLLGTVQEYPEPRAYLAALLDSPYPDESDSLSAESANSLLRNWALDTLLPGNDARLWDPEAIAIVIRRARSLDGVADREMRTESPELSPPISPLRRQSRPNCGAVDAADVWGRRFPERGIPRRSDLDVCHLEVIIGKLRALGIARAFDLVRPTTIHPPVARQDLLVWQHFQGEIRLYLDEWDASQHDGNSYRLKEKDEFVVAHWRETDAKAPAPRMEAIQALLAMDPGKPRPAAQISETALPAFDVVPPVVDRNECCRRSTDSRCNRFEFVSNGGFCPDMVPRYQEVQIRVGLPE